MKTELPPYWYIVNVEAIIVKEGRYLMVTRGEQESHAPGVLAVPGGKVENAGQASNILEATLLREIAEEVDIEVHDDVQYLESNAFIADDGDPVIDIVFLCRYKQGEPRIAAPDEIADLQWLTAEEVLNHPKVPPWTRQSISLAEKKRLEKGW
jgi:8-oxo-dGTP diphosphatase